MKWTESEVKILKSYYRKRGMQYREIGLEMNKTHGAVWNMLNKYGT